MTRTPRTTPVLKPDPPPAPKYAQCQYCPQAATTRLTNDDLKEGIPVCPAHAGPDPATPRPFWGGRR